jgi:hypothetical protein
MKTVSTGLIAILAMVSVASADAPKHVKGDKATGLARALKYAGVKPATAKDVRTFSVANVRCNSTREGSDEQLGEYKCTLDKRDIKDAAAFLLQTELDAAGVVTSDGMSQHRTNADAVKCTLDPSKTGEDRIDCQWTDGPH